MQAIYLTILVLRESSIKTLKGKVDKMKYRNVVMVNLILVCLDDVAMLFAIIDYTSTSEIGLISNAMVGFRASLILIVITSLREVMATDSEKFEFPQTERESKNTVLLP